MFIQKVLPVSNKNNNVKKRNISFGTASMVAIENLTKDLSKRIYGKKGAMEIYSKHPFAEGISLGTTGLPQSWMSKIKDVSQFDLPKFCEKIGRIFTEDRHFSNIDNMKKSLLMLFKQFGIVNEEDKFDVTYLEKGFFGRAYKIDINDDSKVMKEYRRSYRYHNNHGNFAEQNIAEYIDRYSGENTNVVKYHYGDSNNGIMLVDYISKDDKLPENMLELEDIGLGYDDGKPRNLINGYIIDFGGMITVNNLVGNEEAQRTFQLLKYLEDNNQRRELFDRILADSQDENYKDKLIGLTHIIPYFPSAEQVDLYKKMYEFNDTGVNIALVENIKNLGFLNKDNEVVRKLAETDDIQVKEIIAREIKHFPTDLTHSLMEKLSLEDNNTIKKYLARNLNSYYKNIEKRVSIYDNLMKGADTYANIALANALESLPLAERDIRFGQLMSLGDKIVDCALARNIEVFEKDEAMMKKWIDKLMDVESVRVRRALCESVKFMPEKLMRETFIRLLDETDQNAKEFLAETLTSIPGYSSNWDWFDKIFEASGNAVKRELAKAMKDVDSPILREKWVKRLYDQGDSSVKNILKKQGLV